MTDPLEAQYEYEAVNVGDGTWMVKRYPLPRTDENYTESLFRGYPNATEQEMIKTAIERGSWA
jgi:hypothetical protein